MTHIVQRKPGTKISNPGTVLRPALLAKELLRKLLLEFELINQKWRRTKWPTHARISLPKTLKTQPAAQADEPHRTSGG
jgi:hypothetical protein